MGKHDQYIDSSIRIHFLKKELDDPFRFNITYDMFIDISLKEEKVKNVFFYIVDKGDKTPPGSFRNWDSHFQVLIDLTEEEPQFAVTSHIGDLISSNSIFPESQLRIWATIFSMGFPEWISHYLKKNPFSHLEEYVGSLPTIEFHSIMISVSRGLFGSGDRHFYSIEEGGIDHQISEENMDWLRENLNKHFLDHLLRGKNFTKREDVVRRIQKMITN